MQRFVLVTALLAGIPTVATAETPLVRSARQAIPDDVTINASARAASRTIYLNRTGVTLSPGMNDARANTSSLVSAQVHVPGWQASSDLWSQTVTCLREMFAPFDVHLTETDPGNVQHIEAVFGGSAATLGLPVNSAGVSPFSTSCKVIESSIVFTFTDVIPQNARVACEVMAHEIAHSYGLDHELLASDPLSYLSYAGKRAFQDVLADCGEVSPRACGIEGWPSCREKQNSYALLMERIGAAGTGDIDAPIVAITSPANGATVDAGFTITAAVSDDVAVKSTVLSIDGVGAGTLTAAPWQFVAPGELSPGHHIVELTATDGANETVVSIDVVIRGDDTDSSEGDPPIGGCSTGEKTDALFGLLLAGLFAVQRRLKKLL